MHVADMWGRWIGGPGGSAAAVDRWLHGTSTNLSDRMTVGVLPTIGGGPETIMGVLHHTLVRCCEQNGSLVVSRETGGTNNIVIHAFTRFKRPWKGCRSVARHCRNGQIQFWYIAHDQREGRIK